VQRHRDDSVGLGQKVAAGMAEPAPHHWRKVEPVAIFESVHQGARNLVEAYRGAGPMIGRRVGDRFHRQDARSRIVDEGNAEPLAIGPGDERELRPAYWAEPLPFDRLAASGAQTRQGEIERKAQHRARRAGRAFDARNGGNVPQLPHDDTLPLRTEIVTAPRHPALSMRQSSDA